MRGRLLLFALLGACASSASGPRVEVGTFSPGSERATVEAKTGAPRRTQRLDRGQTSALYHVRLVPAPIRSRQSLALHADRVSAPTSLALTVHNNGRRDLDQADLAIAAAELAVDYMIRRVSDSPAPAKPQREREPPPPRLCRVEVVYDQRGRVLHRRIVPLEDAPTQVESWADVAGPVGSAR